MRSQFEYLKSMAFDPFSRHLALRSPLPFDIETPGAGALIGPASAHAIAGGPWSQSECCCDPGPDEFPELEVRSEGSGSH
jgi:hypothetical protein